MGRNKITWFIISVGNFVSRLVFRTEVTTDSSYFRAEDCKVKERWLEIEAKKHSELICS